jgi:uncharacterized iron-regulated membrane protein
MAGFLLLEGITGSLLAYRRSLEELVAPQLFIAHRPDSPPLPLATLAERAEVLAPEARVGYFWVDDRQAVMRMLPRIKPSVAGSAPLAYDHLFLDPWTGRELGRRRDGDLSQGRLNLVPFIYQLHMNLALGEAGTLVLGIVALAWTLDCFTGFYLTLPLTVSGFLRRWKPAWSVKYPASAIRVNYGIHRASGLWLWPLLFVLGWSSVMFNLPAVYEPVTGKLFDYRSDFELLKGLPLHPNPVPRLTWQDAERRGAKLMERVAAHDRFKVLRPYGMAYIAEFGVYTYAVASDANIEANGWATSLWLDGDTGELVSVDTPRQQPSGNLVGLWLRALHFADIRDSLFYRLLVCVLGLVVAALSITGVYIWLRKRSAKAFVRGRDERAVTL